MFCRFALALGFHTLFVHALVAGRMLLRRSKVDSDKMLEGSAERLRLVVENEKL